MPRNCAAYPRCAVSLAQPHHDGSELYVDRLGDSAELRVRAPEGSVDAVLLRYVEDGEPRTVSASVDARTRGEVWWRAELPLRHPVVSYRWLLTGGQAGYTWLNGTGVHPHEVFPFDDFTLSTEPGGPDWPTIATTRHRSNASIPYSVARRRSSRSCALRTTAD